MITGQDVVGPIDEVKVPRVMTVGGHDETSLLKDTS